jgi:Raf kinase inhibitor-like YbhB/YbcL family protein
MNSSLVLFICILNLTYALTNQNIQVSSPDFKNNDFIPNKFVSESVNPTLALENIPINAKSLALIVEDPDAPRGIFYHWAMYNIPITKTIETNTKPGIQVINSAGIKNYKGPSPPVGQRHRYYFRVYALDSELAGDINTVEQLKAAINEHKLAEGFLLGYYQK